MFFEDEACSTILNMLKAMERGSRQTSKERLAVVEAQQNEWGDQFYCGLGGKILSSTASLVKQVVTWFGILIQLQPESSWIIDILLPFLVNIINGSMLVYQSASRQHSLSIFWGNLVLSFRTRTTTNLSPVYYLYFYASWVCCNCTTCCTFITKNDLHDKVQSAYWAGFDMETSLIQEKLSH